MQKTDVELNVGGWLTISRRTIVGGLPPYNGAELEIHFAFMSGAIAKLVPILRTAFHGQPAGGIQLDVSFRTLKL